MPRISIDNYDTVASWNGSQDLFVVEQPDGTKVATPAMVKQYVLGNSIDDIYSVMGQNGAKNLIPYPYNETTQVDHGVTFTVNNDGTVIANGTANGTAQLYLVLGNVSLSAAGNLVINTNKPLFLSGCPSGGGNNTYRIQYGLTDGTTYWAKTASDTGNGVEITPVDGLNSYCFDVIKIMVFDGYAVNNLTFKPMLRLASDTDNTYQPYAMTNKQLTDQLETKQDTLTFDNVPTKNSNNPVKSGGIYSRIGDNSGTLTQRIMLSASGNNSYTVTSDSAIMVAQFEGYLSAASDVYEANVQVNGLMIGYLGVREGVACNPTKREQIRIPFRVFKNDVIKITLSLTGGAVGYATLYTT